MEPKFSRAKAASEGRTGILMVEIGKRGLVPMALGDLCAINVGSSVSLDSVWTGKR